MSSPFLRPLLATEHSEFDSGAEALAFALARHCGLPLAGVLPLLSNPEFEMVAPQRAQQADAEAAAKRLSLAARAQAAGVEFSLHVRRGPEPWEEIVDEARATAADLLIIRRRGKRGLLAQLLVGEMVSKVVAHAPCSVLVSPRGARLWTQRVLVGIAPQAPDQALLAQAARIAGECRMPLRVLCVAANEAGRPAAQHALDASLAQARGLCAQVEGELRTGNEQEQLLAAARDCQADLLVLARQPGRERARLGGAAQALIGQAECPVLVHVPSTPAPTP